MKSDTDTLKNSEKAQVLYKESKLIVMIILILIPLFVSLIFILLFMIVEV